MRHISALEDGSSISSASSSSEIRASSKLDTELCNTFFGDAGKNVAKKLVVVAGLTVLAVLTRNLY